MPFLSLFFRKQAPAKKKPYKKHTENKTNTQQNMKLEIIIYKQKTNQYGTKDFQK